MKASELQASLPAMYYASLAAGGPGFWIESDPGRGKTTIIESFPEAMKRYDPEGNYGVSIINGANFTLMTAMGFMVPKDTPNGMLSVFTMPYWMRTKEGKLLHEYSGGILLVDEADKLGIDEKKIVGEAALSKRLGNHDLPDGWVVMFAANYQRNRSGSTRDLDHLIMRRITLQLQDDVESFVTWAYGKLLPEILTFAEENPQLLFEPQPEDQRPRCSPRTLHQSDIMLRAMMAAYQTNKIPTDPLTQEYIKGGIGAPACAQLIKTIRLGQELHSFEEVVANPKAITLPGKPDAMRLMSYKLASRVDLNTAKPVLEFMSRMPEEHQVMFVRMAIQRNYQLVFQADFAKWCANKTALVAILSRYKVENK